jgi:hypothetical protein
MTATEKEYEQSIPSSNTSQFIISIGEQLEIKNQERAFETKLHQWLRNIANYSPRAKNQKDIYLTIIALLFVLISLWITALGNAITDSTNTNLGTFIENGEYTHIPDLIIDSTNDGYVEIFRKLNLGDEMLKGTNFVTLFFMFLSGDRFATIFRRYSYVAGCLYLLRSFCVNLTVLPNPYPLCIVKDKPNSIWIHAFQIYTFQRVSCGDVFFSGHSILYTLGMWLILTYQSSIILNVISVIYSITGMIFLISSGFHYSIDVLTGFIFATFFWKSFHWAWTIQAFEGSIFGTLLRALDDYRPSGQFDHTSYYNDPRNAKIQFFTK